MFYRVMFTTEECREYRADWRHGGLFFRLEHGKKKPGSAVLVAINREFGKSFDSLF
jgi:hypothetical protein